MTAAQSWLDAMPVIPLVRGVSVVVFDSLRRGFRGVAMEGLSTARYVPVVPDGESRVQVRVEAAQMRVDLADPQGFAYAVRWLLAQPSGPGDWTKIRFGCGPDAPDAVDAVCGHLSLLVIGFGETTDADRLALAFACAEAVRENRS